MDQVKFSGELMRNLSPEKVEDLIYQSKEAKKQAYCPYSKFRVGAALLTHDNHVFTGNVHEKLCLWIV